MSRPIKVRINLRKILKEWVYQGAQGDYLDVVLFERKDGEDRFGNHFSAKQDLPKEARDRGVEAPYVGDAKYLGQPQQSRPEPRQGYQQGNGGNRDDDDGEIPF